MVALFLWKFYRSSTIYDLYITDVATGWSAYFNHQKIGGATYDEHEFWKYRLFQYYRYSEN